MMRKYDAKTWHKKIFIFLFFYFFIFLIPIKALTLTLYTLPKNSAPIPEILYYSGTIGPLKTYLIRSPAEGIITEKNFIMGDQVTQGQKLLQLGEFNNNLALQAHLKEAQINYLKALAHYQLEKNWLESKDVLEAKENLTRAQRTLTETQADLTANQHLFKLGIVSKNDLTQSQDRYLDAKTSLSESQLALNSTLSEGTGNNLQLAVLNLDLAKEKYQSLKQAAHQSDITAPFAGILLPIKNSNLSSNQDSDSDSNLNSNSEVALNTTYSTDLNIGGVIHAQTPLFLIGDMSGITIRFNIPEIDINQIQINQLVTVTSPGFPNISLQGKITQISAEASANNNENIPSFPAIATVNPIPKEEQNKIKIGMDVKLEVDLSNISENLENKKSTSIITIPIQAIHSEPNTNQTSQGWVSVYDPNTQKIHPRKIKIGTVGIDQAQVLSGLSPGEQIVLS